MSRIFIPIMLLVIVSLSCNDPTLVGSSLVTDDVINAKKKSDFEIDVFQHEPDSQLYYVPLTSDQPSRKVQIGIIKDDDNNLFGENIASFFLQLIPLQNAANIENAVLDSAVLELYYDTTAAYGPDIFPHSISVHEVSEDISRLQVYYTSRSFDYDEELIGAIENFAPAPAKDVLLVVDGDTVDQLSPHLRIPIDQEFGQRILNLDSTIIESDSAFLANIKGLYVQPTAEADEWLGFQAYFGGSSPTALKLYFKTEGDTVTQEWRFGALAGNTVALQNYSYNLEGSTAGAALEDDQLSDSLLFLQGNGGLTPGLEIKGLQDLGKILVNKAELEFTFNSLIMDYKSFDPVENVVLVRKGLDGQYTGLERPMQAIRDTISKDPLLIKYIFNIPDYAQKLVDGRIFDPRLRLIPTEALMNPRRSVIFGTKGLNESIRFSLTYTEK